MKLIRILIILIFLLPNVVLGLTFKSDGSVVDNEGNIIEPSKNTEVNISQFEKDLERVSKDSGFIDQDGKIYFQDQITDKSNSIIVIYSHGSQGDQKIDKCLSSWAKVPPVIRDLHNMKIKSYVLKIYRLCSGVRGWTNEEQDRMWRAHEKLGKLDLNLMASDGTQLMDKQKGIQKLKVIKKKLDELIELGFDKIILAGHSSGGWQSLKLKTLYPELITGVIGLNPGAGGTVQNRKDWPWWTDVRYYGFGKYNNLNALILTHDKDNFNSSKDYDVFKNIDSVKKINLTKSTCKGKITLGGYHGVTLTDCYSIEETKSKNIKNYLESLF